MNLESLDSRLRLLRLPAQDLAVITAALATDIPIFWCLEGRHSPRHDWVRLTGCPSLKSAIALYCHHKSLVTDEAEYRIISPDGKDVTPGIPSEKEEAL